MKTTNLQNNAWKNLFQAIVKENGYYECLRRFMRTRKFSYEQMGSMLYNSYIDDAPEDMSPYYFMDSLEDVLCVHTIRGFSDIDDIVQYCYDNNAWKE